MDASVWPRKLMLAPLQVVIRVDGGLSPATPSKVFGLPIWPSASAGFALTWNSRGLAVKEARIFTSLQFRPKETAGASRLKLATASIPAPVSDTVPELPNAVLSERMGVWGPKVIGWLMMMFPA